MNGGIVSRRGYDIGGAVYLRGSGGVGCIGPV